MNDKVNAIDVDCPVHMCRAKPGEQCTVLRGRVVRTAPVTPTMEFGQRRWPKPDGPHVDRYEAAKAVTRFLRRGLGQDITEKSWLAS